MSRLDPIASSLRRGVALPLAPVPIAGRSPSTCTAAMSASSRTYRRTVVRLSCGSRFADFAALNLVAGAAFSPSCSALRSRADRLAAPLELETIVHHLGIALGGRPAAALARRLMLPVSKDTLLRVVRRRTACDPSPLRVIGIDDWAWKRGQRYGSIICDLEQRCIVDLLPDREPATVEAWLSRHPEIAIISRDRGGGYGRAATRAAPQAEQVADRWHLMENASAALLEVVRRSMRPIRQVLGSAVIDPALLTCAERLQHEGYLRREEAYGAIRSLAKAGRPSWRVTSCAAAVAMYSVAGRTRSSRISPGSPPSGRPDAVTGPSCGAVSVPRASEGARVS